MNDKEQLVITCRFAPWGNEDQTYPAFGVKYLIEVPINRPEEVTDEQLFREMYAATIGNGKEFAGEILFIEEVQLVRLELKPKPAQNTSA